MKNGTFTPEERERLSRLGAVLEVRARQIVYSPEFKKECMRRYRAGERPGVFFASAGIPRRGPRRHTVQQTIGQAPSSASFISDIGSFRRTPAPLWLLL